MTEPSLQKNSENSSIPEWDIHLALSLHKDQLPLIFKTHGSSQQREEFLKIKQQADEGDREAQFYIGYCYDRGHNVPQSPNKAFPYLKLAADQGQIQAQILTAIYYEKGTGIEQSHQQAFHYYQLAADGGSSLAQVCLGKLYAQGKGIEQSYKEAMHYYLLAAEQGNSLALEYLSEAYAKGWGVDPSEEKAAFYARRRFETLKHEAEKGHPIAQTQLGDLFERGVGTDKSLESAFYYYKLAADQNYLPALLLLAGCFAIGKGVEPSLEKAMHYFKRAADQGDVSAQAFYAWHLLKSNLDDERAVYYLKLVVQQRESHLNLVPTCQYDLAKCFEQGRGIKKSSQNALHYYRLAADNGNEFAQNRLGDAYLKGELGLKKSVTQAIHYHQLAANQKNSFSLMRLAECYETGDGVAKDFEQAFHYYQLAADIEIKEGRYQSLVQLAKCYEYGIGTEPALDKAIYYYKLAGENGFAAGHYQAAVCYRKLGGSENAEKALACVKMSAAMHYPQAEFELQPNAVIEEINQLTESEYTKKFVDFLENKERNFQLLKTESPDKQLMIAELYLKYKKAIVNAEEEAFKYCQLAAERGYAPAQYQLGCYYVEGIGTNQSLEQAFKYLKLAADQGDVKAQYQVGLCYQEGKGVNPSHKLAMHYFELAADQGLKEAIKICRRSVLPINFLTWTYPINPDKLKTLRAEKMDNRDPADVILSKGRQILENSCYLEDEQLGVDYLKQAAELGSKEAYGDLFNYYHNQQDYQAAIPYLQVLVESQLPSAYYHLGLYYEKGLGGITPSLAEAFKYFKLAANQRRQIEAQMKVGLYYEFGKGVEKSIPDAMHYYEQLANLDYSEAQCRLGQCYEIDLQDPEKAVYYYALAAEQEDARAQLLLGNCYAKGIGVLRSSDEALKYYYLSANQGYPQAYQQLGICFFWGFGVEQSFEQALNYFKQAQAQGLKEAQEGVNSCLTYMKVNRLLADQGWESPPKIIDTFLYVQNKNLETLKQILKDHQHQSSLIYLENITEDEIQVCYDALLKNSGLIIACPKLDSQTLHQVFKSKGQLSESQLICLECLVNDDLKPLYLHFLDTSN